MPDPIEPTSPEGNVQPPPELDDAIVKADAEKAKAAGAAQEPPEGAGEKKVEPPSERTYSQAEWNKRQSAIDTQLAKGKEELGELQKQVDDLVAQSEERKIADWLKSVEAGGGDVDQAKLIAEAQRGVSKQMRELKRQQADLEGRLTLINEAEKVSKARKLVETHSLDKDAEEKLLEAESPEGMEILALSMKVEKLSAEAVPPTKVGSPVVEPKGVDTSKMKIEERMGAAIEEIEQSRQK